MKVKRNREQEQEGNRKHKYLFRGSSHRSTPRLHLREGFPLSTEDYYKVYRRPGVPNSTTYKNSTKELSPQEEHKEQVTKWSQ